MEVDLLGSDFPFADGILDGKTALVCGASKGIGKATALVLARAGCRVIACARSAEELHKLVSDMHGSGHEYFAIDMEDLESVAKFASEAGNIDILVNNSGGPPGGPLLENTVEDFSGPFTRHLHASHIMVRSFAPGMIEAGSGRIVNVISTSVREPIDNIGLSNTLRGAMASWSKSLSRELHPCITINNILPGFTDTDRLGNLANSISSRTGIDVKDVRENWMNSVPIERLIDPLETAVAIAWLCLPSSGAIRGVSLAVDGGRMRSI